MEAYDSPARAEAWDPRDARWDVYVVQPEETFELIARKLGMTEGELRELNPHARQERPPEGERLRFPMRAEEYTDFSQGAAERCAGEGAFVQAREAFAADAPPVPSLPVPAHGAPPAQPFPAQPQLPTPELCPVGYLRVTLPQGWEFSNVLRRYNVSYQALANANPGLDIDSLGGGQRLCVPPAGSRGLCEGPDRFTYIIERSDSLDSLARKHRVSVGCLLRANPTLTPEDFTPGRVVCVPC